MRPASIIRFERLFLTAQAASLIGTALHYQTASATLQAGQEPAPGSALLVSALALGFGVPLLLWFLIAHRASNAARWVMVVLAGYGLIGLAPSMRAALDAGPLALAANIVYFVLYLASVVCLFGGDAAAWFDRRGRLS